MKGILCSVGTLQLFDIGTQALVLSAKTLSESSINMEVSTEEARGGEGNYLLGQYFHDTKFTLKATDQIWDLKYLAMNCGGNINRQDIQMVDKQYTVTSNTITLDETPSTFMNESVVWVKKQSDADDKYETKTFSGTSVSYTADNNTVVCVKYFVQNNSAREFTVNASYIPDTYYAILTVPVFRSGMTENTGTNASSKIGELQIHIPRFQLDGTQELSLTSSGMSKVSLSGKALATTVNSCDGQGYYSKIVEIEYGADEWADVIALVVENSNIALGSAETETLKVYKMYAESAPVLCDPSTLIYTPTSGCTVSSSGVVSAVTADSTITITADTDGDNVASDETLTATAHVTYVS